ncbi:AI-2E family transporter [Solimonas marina]|uniref:AI-2E family transporter n=1 Tax=Solimonas marina TaxID=2714601 RepID=A0A969WC09_9GAMM|nr:AI-2E family transporter [Solimonas marina]NKF24596.1 AI-2E family transporter [Solimonas marina]
MLDGRHVDPTPDMEWPRRGLRTTLDLRSTTLAVLAVLAVIAAIKLAADVLVPIVLAVSLSYLLTPLVDLLRRRLRIPEAAGAFLVLAVLVAAIVGGAIALQPHVSDILDNVPKATQRLESLLHRTALDKTGAIRKLTAAANALDEAAASGAAPRNDITPDLPAPSLRAHLWSAAGTTAKAIGQTVVVLALSYFLMVAGHSFKRKLVRISGRRLHEKKLTVQILDEIDLQMQRYLRIQVGTSALVGAGTGVAFAAIGMSNAVLWGVAAALLHLIPYIGSTFIVALAAMFAYLQFNDVQSTLLVAGSALAIAGVVGLGIVPWLTERVGRINAVATFVTLLVWDWLWGVPGLLLGIPIMMAVMAICERVDGLQAVAELLRSDGRQQPRG